MSNADAVVKITRPNGFGAGVFVTDDLVITAGHVVYPPAGYFGRQSYRVLVPDGRALAITGYLCLRGWSNGGRASEDMGILRVRDPQPSLVVPYLVDPTANDLDVTIVGYGPVTYDGTVSRFSSPPAPDVFTSSDLAFPSGVSGGPILDRADQMIGIATRSAPTAQPDVIVGLPCLQETIEWLIANCP